MAANNTKFTSSLTCDEIEETLLSVHGKIGQPNGIAQLGANGKIPTSQIPGSVDEVQEYATLSAFPVTGVSDVIYIALDTNKTYRWSGSSYVVIGSDLALGETDSTAYAGNKGKANADAIAALQSGKLDKNAVGVNSGKIQVQINGVTYIIKAETESVVKPNAPTIATLGYNVVTGNASVSLSNIPSGATAYYKVDNGAWTSGSSISIASGFANNADNTEKTFSVKTKSSKYGLESDENSYTITITPKVSAGSVSVSRNNNNNDWSTQATITFNPSASKGAKSEYSTDGGAIWSEFTASFSETTNASKGANQYQVRATKTNYTSADTAKSSAFTLNAKKVYYGFSTKDVLESSDVAALTGGSSLEATGISSGTKYSITASSAGYLWICQTGTLTPAKIFGDSTYSAQSGFNNAVSVGGWNCYRITNKIAVGSYDLYLKP